jgi:hypothetical protein
MGEQTQGDGRSLEEMAETDRRLARQAAHDAGLERPVAAGRPDHPHPDIAAADELRARDDVRTYETQAEVAEGQAQAAQTLDAGRRALEENREALDDARRTARHRTSDSRALADDVAALRQQTSDVRDAARDVRPPDVED